MKMHITLFVFMVSISALAENRTEPLNHGRFQLIQLGSVRKDQFLVDTVTGQIWGRRCNDTGTDGMSCFGPLWQKEVVEGITVTDADLSHACYDQCQKIVKEKKSGTTRACMQKLCPSKIEEN